MKTADEIKDQIAQKYCKKNWNDFTGLYSTNELNALVDEAMQEYARVCCVEQKQICSLNVKYGQRDDVFKNRISVINSKLATES